MYSIESHAAMARDRHRIDAFAAALAMRITPGCTVVDLGAGSGVLSILACRLGAGRVVAIEPDDVIELARRNAAASGVDAKIEFRQAPGSEVVLDQPGDVLVSDLRGALPWFDGHLPAVLDARRRLLRLGGAMIGERDELRVAVVSDAALHESRVAQPRDSDRLNLAPMRSCLTNHWAKAKLAPGSLVGEPRLAATIDYRTFERLDLATEIALPIDHDCVAHGFGVWFDAELAPGVTLSNAPGSPELVYGTPFFPWPEPVALHAGDVVRLSLRATPGARDYTWTWRTSVDSSDGISRVSFDQSTFFAAVLPEKRLHTAKATFVPRLSPKGERDRDILDLMDGRRSNEEIAHAVESRFESFDAALTRVSELAAASSR